MPSIHDFPTAYRDPGPTFTSDSTAPPRPETVEVPVEPPCPRCGSEATQLIDGVGIACPDCGCVEEVGDVILKWACDLKKKGVHWQASAADLAELRDALSASPTAAETGVKSDHEIDQIIRAWKLNPGSLPSCDGIDKLIASLRAKLAEAEAQARDDEQFWNEAHRVIGEKDATIAQQAKRIAELEAGLRPFKNAARRIPKGFIIVDLPYGLVVDDLRHAAHLLSPQGEADAEGGKDG